MKKPISRKNKNIYICFYDIEDDKRRNKLIKFLKKIGIRIQKSVFLVFIDNQEKQEIIEYFKKIKNKEDKLGLSFICKNCFREIYHIPHFKISQYDLI